MATEQQLMEGLRKADAAGNTADAQHFADSIKTMRLGQGKPPPDAKTSPPPKEKPVSWKERGGAFLYGLGSSLLGEGADLPYMTEPLPTTETKEELFRRAGFEKPREEVSGYRTAGEFAPAVVGGITGIAGLAKAGAQGLTKAVSPLTRKLVGTESTESIANLSKGLETGQIGKNLLSRPVKAAARRKNVADRLYEVAEDRMAARVAKGDVWQESQAGKEFFKDIENRLSTTNATKVTSDTRKVLTDLARELAGTARADGSVAHSTPKVLTTVLRELREAAKGDPKEGFKALGQQEAGDLAKKLSASLGKWEPSAQSADVQYAAHTKDLYPKGVPAGKFSKEKKTAEKTINLLENRFKQGTVKADEVTTKVRELLKSPSIARLADESDIRQINTELDAIDKIKAKEDKVRAIAKFAAKWIGAGALAGAGIDLAKGHMP